MKKEIERLMELLRNESPLTPNYDTILAKISTLTYLVADGESAPRIPLAIAKIKYGEDDKGLSEESTIAEEESIVAEPIATEEPTTPEIPVVEETTPVVTEEPEYSIEEVRQAIKEAQAKGVDARPFIAAYGVKNLSGVPKESYGALIAEVTNA